jgi:error-prone DNA polymerase
MARQGIAGDAAEGIIRSITSFALYGFPESHAASFALLVYASAYLKAHYPAAFSTAMLNNQPMGFYHPATLVKDAQRHGVRFAPIDVQESDWECRVEPDGRVRLGLMYVNGLRQEMGKLIASGGRSAAGSAAALHENGASHGEGGGTGRAEPFREGGDRCPKCGCDDASMLEETVSGGYFCNICAHEWGSAAKSGSVHRQTEEAPGVEDAVPLRYASIDDLVARTGVRRDELATLAEIGALNAFGHDRRSALWQIEKAVRPAGRLFASSTADSMRTGDPVAATSMCSGDPAAATSTRVLKPMTPPERLMADYAGTSLTIGPHPLALRRAELALRGVLRAIDLPRGRHGRRVRVAGAVITRQRPGTAKGFVFLTLEDETGIANIIVRPDLFTEQRGAIVGEPYLLVEGTLQIQEGVTSIKAERVLGLTGGGPDPQSHDFR